MPATTNGSAESASPFTDDFTQFAKDILCEWNIPGAAIAVVDGNEIFSEVRPSASLHPPSPGFLRAILTWHMGELFLAGIRFFKSS